VQKGVVRFYLLNYLEINWSTVIVLLKVGFGDRGDRDVIVVS
jgi:hypothetical protein